MNNLTISYRGFKIFIEHYQKFAYQLKFEQKFILVF